MQSYDVSATAFVRHPVYMLSILA